MDGSKIAACLKAIGDAVQVYMPSSSFAPSPEQSVHDNVVSFLAFVTGLASGDGDLDHQRREAVLIVSKAREHTAYLDEKCKYYGASLPDEWKNGVSLHKEPTSFLNRLNIARRNRARRRSQEAQIALADAVREQIKHFFNLSVVEIPRDERARAEALAALGQRISISGADVASQASVQTGITGWYWSNPEIQGSFRPNSDLQVSASLKILPLPAESAFEGELPGFIARLEGEGELADGDTVVYRIPLDADVIWDPDFATIFAATVDVDNHSAIAEIRLAVGDENGVACEHSLAQAGLAHLTTAWRFRTPPRNPYLQIKIILRATISTVGVTVTRLFAGHDYDPYVFNPLYAGVAAREGRPSFHGSEQILAEFERKARLACRTDSYFATQAFVRPYLVMREGDPRFPMLIGTANSVIWYGFEPRHGIEEYKEWGCISEGDIAMDCGAHAGQMAAYFSCISGPRGRVIAFDPFAQNCLQIEAQDRLNSPGRIRVVKAGVGARRQTLSVSNLEQKTTTIASHKLEDLTDIEIVPLDDFLDEKPTFIKLDVEGAEVDALIGAAKILRLYTPKIFIEVHTQFIGNFGYNLTDFFSKIPADLYDINFMVEGIDNTWRPYEPGLELGITAPLMVFAVPKQTVRAAIRRAPVRAREAVIANLETLVLQQEAEINSIGSLLRQRESTIANLETLVLQREAEIKGVGSLLRERESVIANLENLVFEREAEINGVGNLLRERESAIANLKTAVLEREAEIAGVRRLFQERESAIANLETLVLQREAEAKGIGSLLLERESAIAKLEILVLERETEIETIGRLLREREAVVLQREEEINGVGSLLRDRETAIANLETLVQHRVAEIDSLGSLLRERESAIANFETILQQREAEINGIGSLLLERESAIAKLETLVLERETEIETIGRLLREREAVVLQREEEINVVGSLLRDRETAIANLETLVQRRVAEIDSLGSLLRERESAIANFETILQQREAEIKGVGSLLRERESAIANFETILQQREAEIDSIGSLLRERESAIANFETDLQQREAEIDSIGSLLLERESAIANFETILQQREAEIKGVGSLLLERESAIANFETILQQRKAEIDSIGSLLLERESAIANFETLLQQRKAEIDSIGSLLRERESAIANFETLLQQREAEIKGVGSLLLERESAIANFESILQQREAEIKGVESLLLERESAIANFEAILQQREAEIKGIESLLRERESTIASLETLRQQREAEIKYIASLLRERESAIANLETLLQQRQEEIRRIGSRLPEITGT
jgi:FkbM family methyltransferase